MPLLCPNCRAPIEPATNTCAIGHGFIEVDGVLQLLSERFVRRLADFETALSAARKAEGKHQLSVTAYEQLPFSRDADFDAGMALEWRLRRYDLALIQERLSDRPKQRVLDVGAWNGWLSHQLAAAGHCVTAVDYFSDPHDGLRARRFYRAEWRAIQMDLRDPSLLDEQFDLIVVNRCLAFFTDPAAYLHCLKPLVAPGGQLVVTGLQFFWNGTAKAARVAADRQRYRDQYGFELFLFPTRGFLDRADHTRLKIAGLALYPYPQLWAANLKARVLRSRPRHAYGVWVNTTAAAAK
jgi:SAM-dependent methyltransferase